MSTSEEETKTFKFTTFTTVDPICDGSNWFAYCNNEPVNFQDLWGLRKLTAEEIALHKAAGGGPVDYDSIDLVNGMPTPQQVRDAAASAGVDLSGKTDAEIQKEINEAGAMSLPSGKVYVPQGARNTQEKVNALIVHEVEHQSQYQNGDSGEVFKDLLDEGEQYNEHQMDPNQPDPYDTPGCKEYDAQQVENKANDLYSNGWTPRAATSPCNYN
ncbi:MAG: hypothetical protein GX660_19685 [Clostridiaceae bacterium]|nr:hypothetical protein [Clostridiaceae bacterium]